MSKKQQFINYLEQIGFTHITQTGYTWAQLGNKFGIHPSTLRRWSKNWLKSKQKNTAEDNTPVATKQLVKSWEMLTKDGVVELHSYKYDTNIEKVIKEAVNDIINIIKRSEKPREGNTDLLTDASISQSNKSTVCLFLGDVHIGMDIKNSIFGYEWNRKELMKRREMMIRRVIDTVAKEGKTKDTEIVVVIGGDLVDGFDGQTTRKRHELPQNMDNKEQLTTAFEFLYTIIDDLSESFHSVSIHIITNSNHGGILEYAAAKMIEQVVPARFDNVQVVVHEDFMNTITIGTSPVIITHGYDDNIMNKGFTRFLTKNHFDLIKNYNRKEKGRCKILIRFDQHQYHDILYDDIRDVLVPAFAPPSSYISYNYGSSFPGGFVIYNSDYEYFRMISF